MVSTAVLSMFWAKVAISVMSLFTVMERGLSVLLSLQLTKW